MKHKIGLRAFPRGSISYTGAEAASGCRRRGTALLLNTGKLSPNCQNLEVLGGEGYHHTYPLGFKHNGVTCALWLNIL